MSKIQIVYCLLLFLIVLFSMDMIFGNMLLESFRGGGGGRGGLGLGRSGLGLGLGTGLGLGVRDINLSSVNLSSDDQPFYYEFPWRSIFIQTQ